MVAKRWSKRFITGIFGIILFLSLSGLPGLAIDRAKLFILDEQPTEDFVQPPATVSPTSTSPTSTTPRLNDPQEFEAFIDQLLNQELESAHIPGAVISVVKDGDLFFTKGYGYADLENNIPVDADRTLFRVASLSKLVTDTAVMQLYERGLLDLDEDISPYLDYELENPFPEPVTPARLMTHTDGSTKRRIGLAARTEADLEPLAEYMPDHTPPIVYPPGELYSYSSHAIALLGYVIEQITGTPFPDYADEQIFQPLNMQRSTFLQPPPSELTNDLAVGYQRQGGTFKPIPYLYLNIGPAAALQTTAIDMAQFMLAHLQNGQSDNTRILEEDTLRLMHETHYAPHPLLPGTAYGFHERLVNNLRTLDHSGSLRGYSSSITLMPDQNIGIFIATNNFSGIQERLLTKFFDRYFPVPDRPLLSDDSVEIDPQRYTGVYRDLEYPRHTLGKLSAVFGEIRITAPEDNVLSVEPINLVYLNAFKPKRLVPVDPLLFRRPEDNALTGFGEDENGNIVYAFNPIYPVIGTYLHVPWYETVWFHGVIVIGCSLLFFSGCIAWVIRPLVQRLRQKSDWHKRWQEQPQRWALILAGLIGGLNLIFLIGLPLYLWFIGVWKLAYGVPTVAIAFLCIPILTTTLTLVLPVIAVLSWSRHRWSLARRSHFSLVTLASLVFIPILAYWNLLGFQF